MKMLTWDLLQRMMSKFFFVLKPLYFFVYQVFDRPPQGVRKIVIATNIAETRYKADLDNAVLLERLLTER